MKKGLLIGFGALILLVLMLGGWLVGKYNTLVELSQNVEQAQGQVEVVLQRRFDLIPNLVNSAQAVLDQEDDIFGMIAEARTKYAGAESGSEDKLEAAEEYESAIGRLLVIMENYPELKSNETIADLFDQLEGTENRISVERGRYNETVTEYNKYIKKFPNVLIANLMGFDEAILFEAVDGADEAPEVNFDNE